MLVGTIVRLLILRFIHHILIELHLVANLLTIAAVNGGIAARRHEKAHVISLDESRTIEEMYNLKRRSEIAAEYICERLDETKAKISEHGKAQTYFHLDTLGILGDKLSEQSRHLAVGIGLLGQCVSLIDIFRRPLLVESPDGSCSLLFDARFLGAFAACDKRP